MRTRLIDREGKTVYEYKDTLTMLDKITQRYDGKLRVFAYLGTQEGERVYQLVEEENE